ncbi:conserved hypothetical protein [Ricinus communis]|uniref:Uncharacterized protein n=1 Tax=Ricinus communis TaxID=3988 RepID=B9SLC0_RICCO|nr:conserved hypothetical protein [Ricinus communis]
MFVLLLENKKNSSMVNKLRRFRFERACYVEPMEISSGLVLRQIKRREVTSAIFGDFQIFLLRFHYGRWTTLGIRSPGTTNKGERFPKAQLFYEELVGSSHRPLLLYLKSSVPRRRSSFKFESKWDLDLESRSTIDQVWHQFVRGSHSFKIMTRLKKSRKALMGWSKEILGCDRDYVVRALKPSSILVVDERNMSKFLPSRGLRQQDPSSPYLFILVFNALSKVIKAFHNNGNVSGYKIKLECPPITHGWMRMTRCCLLAPSFKKHQF